MHRPSAHVRPGLPSNDNAVPASSSRRRPATHPSHRAFAPARSPAATAAGAYAVAPVAESASGAKALQMGSGCPRSAYWAGHYAWDLLMHAGVTAVAMATFAAFGDEATTGSVGRAAAAVLLIFGYGVGVAPLSYCYSFGFTSPSTAQVGDGSGEL